MIYFMKCFVRGVARTFLCFLCLLLLLFMPGKALARSWRPSQYPNGVKLDCAACHIGGGGGPRTPFGLAVEAIVTPGSQDAFWSAALAALDSDEDGFTNGEEVGDPEGDGIATVGFVPTNPGDAASNPLKNKMPTAKITAPTSGSKFTDLDVITLTATAKDTEATGTIAKVAFFDGTKKLGEVTSEPYTLNVTLPAGTHAIVAKATDGQNGTGTSAQISISVSVAPVTLTSFDAHGNGSVLLKWTGGAGPFVVQSKRALEDAVWNNGAVFGTREAVQAAANTAGFFRIFDLASLTNIPLSVSLSGAFQVPSPVVTDASGFGLLKLEGDNLVYDIRAIGLSGPVTGAHIHGPASTAESAPVLIHLEDTEVGGIGKSAILSSSIALTPEQKAAILNGRTYVNFHTDANPNGEIRGQIAPVVYQALLDGSHERPTPVDTAASGSANLLLIGNQLHYNFAYRGLSGSATAASIHGPASEGEVGDILVDIAKDSAGSMDVQGSFAGTITLSPAQISAVISEKAYLNVKTAGHPDGEIRGQIRPRVSASPFTAKLSGDAVRPTAVNSPASGLAILLLESSNLTFNVSYSGFTNVPSAIQFNGPATSTNTAGTMVDLTPFHSGTLTTNGGFSGTISLVTTQLTALTTGKSYLNLPTALNAKGELRGQIVPALMRVNLSGDKVKPVAVSSKGIGNGLVLLSYDQVFLALAYSGLTNPVTASQVHGPASTLAVSNPGILDLEPFKGSGFGTFGGLFGQIPANTKLIQVLVDSLTYIDLRTTKFPNGELRGQITR